MQIREANLEDFEQIYALNKEFAQLYDAEDKFTLSKEQLIADRDLFNCRVAVIDGEVVGFTTFFTAYYTWAGKAIYLDDLFVTADQRNKGIGDKLLDDIISIAKDSNCKRVVWQVSDWNKKAQAFYKRKGAVIERGELNCIYSLTT